MNSAININVQLTRGSFQLDAELQLPGHGVSVIYGHSGSGKTTLLRCIAGLEKVAGARIQFKNTLWQNDNTFLPTYRRPLAYVFQEASLFDHLTAKKNLEFAIKRAEKNSTDDFDKTVSLLGIEKILNQYPSELSGGERQRVAIARALLVKPSLLLMDEPLASLDYQRKQEILPYLEKLRSELKLPIIYVSHSIDEVARLADHLVVLNQGKVVSSGDIQACLARVDLPINLAEEAGSVISASVVEKDSEWQMAKVHFSGGELWLRDNGATIGQEIRVRILARDISLALSEHKDSSILNILPAEIINTAIDQHRALTLVQLKLGNDLLLARISTRSATHMQLKSGMPVWVQIKSVAIV